MGGAGRRALRPRLDGTWRATCSRGAVSADRMGWWEGFPREETQEAGKMPAPQGGKQDAGTGRRGEIRETSRGLYARASMRRWGTRSIGQVGEGK